jgi:hypothetical protein
MQTMKQKIRKWFAKFKNYTIAYWAGLQDWFAVIIRFLLIKAKHILIPIQRVFGFEVISVKQKTLNVDISSFLTSTDQILAAIPKNYREHFLIHREIEEGVYVRSEHASMTEIKKVFDAWKEEIPSTVAVIGEKGSGKSVYLDQVESEIFQDIDCMTISIDQSTWKMEQFLTSFAKEFGIENVKRPEAFIHELKQQAKQRVVILENVQNLYIRNINGYDVLDALWLILSETKDQIFWVCSCSRYAWNFLNKGMGIETHFNLIQHTDSLKRDQIEALIMNRHNLSKYELEFLPDDEIRKNRSYKKRLHKPEELQLYLREKFFDQLAEDAKGNASVAIILWQRSIQSVEKGVVTISTYKSFSIESLEALTSEIVFVTAAFILHDTLKVAELSRILNIDLSASRVLLTRLKSKGILVEQAGLFSLNQLVYRQVLSYLQRRNVIH